MTVFNKLIFDKVITLMETFDVVMVYNFLMFFLVFDVVIFVVVTFSQKHTIEANHGGGGGGVLIVLFGSK